MNYNKKPREEEHSPRAYIYLVKNPSSNDVTVCAADSVFYPGTHVIAPTKYGLDLGIVLGSASDLGQPYVPGCTECRGACHLLSEKVETEPEDNLVAAAGEEVIELPAEEDFDDAACWDSRFRAPQMVEVEGDVPWISHLATPDELKRYQKNLEEEKEAIVICREKIAKHNLDMKLVTAHFILCEPKAMFFFTSEGRVDFRDLVKDLVSVFRMRIELRQIGVRDESKVLGGLAVCGRDYCCHCVSDKLNPVTIRMAKEQNLSLNSMKISGPCGRLLCCLSYEYDFYMEEKQDYPSEGSRLKIGGELFRVTEVNILSRKVTVIGPEGGMIFVPRSELYFSDENNRWEITREYQEQILST